MSFSDFRSHSEPIFKEMKILKISDNIKLQNSLFIHDYLNGKLPSSFNDTFTKVNKLHNYNTRAASSGKIATRSVKTVKYGKNATYNQCITSWNETCNTLNTKINNDRNIDLQNMPRNKVKTLITNHMFNTYQNHL